MKTLSLCSRAVISGLVPLSALALSVGARASGSPGAVAARDYEIWALDQGTHMVHILSSKLEEVARIDMTAQG